VKYQILQNADVFALASLHEGFGVVYLEAMFSGLPIVAANEGGQVDILKDDVTGYLVNAGNVPEMTGALKKLLDDAALRNRIGSHNRARAEQYTIARVTAQYEEVFGKLVGKELPSFRTSAI
jgi:glycosyltransferase involved in cell wall biosynthesis